MSKLDRMKYANSQAISTMNAAYSLAENLYVMKPDYSLSSLKQFANTARLKVNQDRVTFKICFLERYLALVRQNGNTLPTTNKEIDTIMGKLNKAKEAVSNNPTPFVKVKKLVEADASFCIRHIHSGKGQYGKQWYLTIFVDELVAPLLQEDGYEGREFTVTLPDRGVQRDKVLESLQAETPIHCCKFNVVKTKSGTNYNDLIEDEDNECVCGEEEDEEASSGEDVDPWLDDEADF